MKSHITPKDLKLGPIMCDVNGPQLDADECEILLHPLIGGVILFSRNFDSPEQLVELTEEINRLRQPSLLIAVDHEGGKVQRFRNGFSQLPACGLFGSIQPMERAQSLAKQAGWLMAAELLSVRVDFSFAPVLDIGGGFSKVIGDRAFDIDPNKISRLARAFVTGMNEAGMAAVGKHFPGHGSVIEDSHVSVPVDSRPFSDINTHDLIPFKSLIDFGISGLMPAHVIYSEIDTLPAGFSSVWVKDILRKKLNFKGTIFSDDLSMAGAEIVGDYTERTMLAFKAGCDIALICNNKKGLISVLDESEKFVDIEYPNCLEKMRGKFNYRYDDLRNNQLWVKYSKKIECFQNE